MFGKEWMSELVVRPAWPTTLALWLLGVAVVLARVVEEFALSGG
jgi:hypothetical protein